MLKLKQYLKIKYLQFTTIGFSTEEILAYIVRTKLKGISTNIDFLEGLERGVYLNLLAQGEQIHNSAVFEKVINSLIEKQKNFTVKEAVNMPQVNFGRATINGLQLVKEEFDRLHGLYEQEMKQDESIFNKYGII